MVMKGISKLQTAPAVDSAWAGKMKNQRLSHYVREGVRSSECVGWAAKGYGKVWLHDRRSRSRGSLVTVRNELR